MIIIRIYISANLPIIIKVTIYSGDSLKVQTTSNFSG